MALPNIGYFQYNGVTFPPDTCSEVETTPVYDEADRSVIYLKHTINASTTLTAASLISLEPWGQPGESGDSTDTVMTILRQRLTQPAAALVYQSKGFGDLTCNANTGVLDVNFGPKPRVVRWKPLGPAAAEVTWSCDVCLPECSGAVYQGTLLSLNYTQDFSIDHCGNCSRSTTGVFSIPMTRKQDFLNAPYTGTTELPDTADAYWPEVFEKFSIPVGFRRTTNQRYLDYSKRQMRFRLVDTQMGENILPADVVECAASQSVTSASPKTIHGQYVTTFNMTVVMARGVPRARSIKVFLDWIYQRLNAAYQAGQQPLPVRFEFEEMDIFAQNAANRFSLTVCLLKSINKENADFLIDGTGIWLPTDTDWHIWHQSMIGREINTEAGHSRLFASKYDDSIVSVCSDSPNIGGVVGWVRLPVGGPDVIIPSVAPNPESSWLDYENKFVYETQSGTVKHKLLPDKKQADGKQDEQDNKDYAADEVGTSIGDLVGAYYSASVADTVQNRAAPNVKFRLVGHATRVAYQIPMPTLTSISGKTVKPSGSPQFSVKQIANFGWPVYRAEWSIAYDIPYGEYLKNFVAQAPGSPVSGQDTESKGLHTYAGYGLKGNGIDPVSEGESDVLKQFPW